MNTITITFETACYIALAVGGIILLFAIASTWLNNKRLKALTDLDRERDAHLKATKTNSLLQKANDNAQKEIDSLTEKLESAMSIIDEQRIQINRLDEKLNHAEADRVELRAERLTAENKVAELTNTCDEWKSLYYVQLNRADRFEALHKRMTTRQRDPKTGRIVKADWVSDESRASASEQMQEQSKKPQAWDDSKIDTTISQFTPFPPKPSHRLTHGLTVKNPTEDEAKAIFAEAKRLGIKTFAENRIELPFIHFSVVDTVSRCSDSDWPVTQAFVTPSEFIARMQPLKRVTDLGEMEVIHCPTIPEAEAICRLMDEAEYYTGLGYTIHQSADFLHTQANKG